MKVEKCPNHGKEPHTFAECREAGIGTFVEGYWSACPYCLRENFYEAHRERGKTSGQSMRRYNRWARREAKRIAREL